MSALGVLAASVIGGTLEQLLRPDRLTAQTSNETYFLQRETKHGARSPPAQFRSSNQYNIIHQRIHIRDARKRQAVIAKGQHHKTILI